MHKLVELDDTTWRLRELDLEKAVYAAAVEVFERMEHDGEIFWNGHHAAQELAGQAVKQLRSLRIRGLQGPR